MNLQQVLDILAARRRSLAMILAIVMGVAVGLSLLLPKRYTATAELLVDAKAPDPLTGAGLATNVLPSFMATQIDVLQSGRVARRVIQELDLLQSEELRKDWGKDTGERGDFEAWLAKELRKDLKIRPSRESNALTITYSARDPEFAAAAANAFVQAYIDVGLELRVEPSRQFNAFFDERAKAARDALEAAQGKLLKFQADRGLIATDERFDIETARLQELSSQLVMLQAVAAESGGRSVQATQNAERLPEVMNNPLVSQLTTDLNRQRARLEELQSRLGDNHPQVQETKASIAELRRRVAAESSRVAGGVGLDNRVAQTRLAQLQVSLNEQRTKVLRLKQQRAEAAVLEREVENARAAYQAILQRLNQTGIETQAAITNASFLERASAPTEPSSPKLLLNTVMALVLGSILAVGVTLGRELTDRRVRSAKDVEQLVEVPVLGTLPLAGRTRPAATRAELVLERRPFASLPRPEGTTP
jgi:polysaccharide biosynthesis transport protein